MSWALKLLDLTGPLASASQPAGTTVHVTVTSFKQIFLKKKTEKKKKAAQVAVVETEATFPPLNQN